jgi:hypothetical protein
MFRENKSTPSRRKLGVRPLSTKLSIDEPFLLWGLRRGAKIGPCDYTTPERFVCLTEDVSVRSSFSSPSSPCFLFKPQGAPRRERRLDRRVHGVKHLRHSTRSSRPSCQGRVGRRRACHGGSRSLRLAVPVRTRTAVPASTSWGSLSLRAGSWPALFFPQCRTPPRFPLYGIHFCDNART